MIGSFSSGRPTTLSDVGSRYSILPNASMLIATPVTICSDWKVIVATDSNIAKPNPHAIPTPKPIQADSVACALTV